MMFFVVSCDINSEARWRPRTLVRSLLIISNFICFCKQVSFLGCLNQRKSKTLAKRLGRNTVYLVTRCMMDLTDNYYYGHLQLTIIPSDQEESFRFERFAGAVLLRYSWKTVVEFNRYDCNLRRLRPATDGQKQLSRGIL